MTRDKISLGALLCVAVLVGTATAARAAPVSGKELVRVTLGARVTDRFQSNAITVGGLTAHTVDVRLLGAIDMTGRAYEWAPYRWQRLQLRQGVWRGVLPAPVLLGVYQLQLRLDHGRRLITSTHWLERVFPHGTRTHGSFATAAAAIRDYVADLPGHQRLVAMRRWPLPAYDHRNGQLHRLFVIAYAPRGRERSAPALGTFVTTVRDGFHGRWLLLEATTEPPG